MFGNSRFALDSGHSFGSLQAHGFFRNEQRSGSSRPNGKSIYMQRKEYAESMSRQPDNFEYRVQHLFTLELDGRQMKDTHDCVARLKQLDSRGRVWAQEMILEVRGVYLQLCDIETKEELETVALGSIADVQAVLDTSTFNSLLMVTIQEGSQRKVLMFQCEEVGAENIRDDLRNTIQHKKGEASNHLQRNQHSIRNNLENIIGQEARQTFRNSEERYAPPVEEPPPQWNEPEHSRVPSAFAPQEVPHEGRGASPAPSYSETERSVDIFNHLMNDVEIFMAKVSAATSNQKGKKKVNKQRKGAAVMPPWDEFISCLQKIKYGFNIMGTVNGQISNPSGPDFVHILFSTLGFVVSHCPPDVPPSVIIPLLTETALRLMAQVVTPEEDQLWQSLGDAWNIPSSKWLDEDTLPPYMPKFYDGWQPPSPVQTGPSRRNVRRSTSQQHPAAPEQVEPETPQGPAVHVRVMYDFMARNPQELSVVNGDVIQVLDQSKQWWLVRNNSNQEGYVPHNLLEPLEEQRPPDSPALPLSPGHRSPPSINMMSSPSEVRAWLEYKGFLRITVQSLGVLSGSLLLGMTRDELRTVCPEESGRVFFHLQGVKSSLALASENGADVYRGR
ncbi:epidermal growth factor receptor kinase substrate 8-like protein 3 [Arapaima gigas]